MRLPHLLSSMASVSGITLLTLAAYLVAMLMLGRTLSREAFGQFNLSVYTLNLLGMASLLGFPNALLRRIPRDRLETSDWPRFNRSLAAINTGVCVVGVAVHAALYDATLVDSILLLIAAVFLGQSLFLVTVLQISRRFATAQGLFTLWRPVLCLAAALLAWGVVSGVSFLLGAIAVGAVLQYVLLRWVLRDAPSGPQPIRARELAHDAGVFFILGLTAVLITRMDSFFLPRLASLDALGLYSALSFYALTAFSVVGLGVGQVLNPLLASRESLPMGRIVLILSLGGSLLGLLLVLLANWAVPFAFGDKYLGSHRTVVAALSVAGLLQVMYAIPSSRIGILASPRVLRWFIVLSLSSVVIDVALILLLLPRWGLAGAASATAGTWAWRTAGSWWVASRTTHSTYGFTTSSKPS